MLTSKRKINFFNLYHLLSTGFGIGRSPWIPGTLGSLIAIPFWYILVMISFKLYLLLIILSFYLGIYLCHKTTQDIGIYDHNCIVWDEFIGMWITLLNLPINKWKLALIGFLLFRLVDIWKPWPISWCDRKIHGGIGIIIDDVLAGIISAIFFYWIIKIIN